MRRVGGGACGAVEVTVVAVLVGVLVVAFTAPLLVTHFAVLVVPLTAVAATSASSIHKLSCYSYTAVYDL